MKDHVLRCLNKTCPTCEAKPLEECKGLDSDSTSVIRRFHPARIHSSRRRESGLRYKFVRQEAIKPTLYPQKEEPMAKAKPGPGRPAGRPTTIFITEQDDHICLNLVCMTRWDGKVSPSLMVFFTTGPHINLELDEGKKFLKALKYYHGIQSGFVHE